MMRESLSLAAGAGEGVAGLQGAGHRLVEAGARSASSRAVKGTDSLGQVQERTSPPPPSAAPPRPCATPSTPSTPRALACLRAKSKAPKTVHAAWPKERDDDLRALLHQCPRTFGKPTSLWTLPLAAQVCYEKGWTARVLSGEAIRLVLKRLGVGWKRAKHWLTSPDPAYARKKKCATN